MSDENKFWADFDASVAKTLAAHKLPTNPSDLIGRNFRFRYVTFVSDTDGVYVCCAWGKILGCRVFDRSFGKIKKEDMYETGGDSIVLDLIVSLSACEDVSASQGYFSIYPDGLCLTSSMNGGEHEGVITLL
ncbi:hypothetical protein KBC59_04405 [Patescibacteria group bacterium]|jgi:hypothetical protein|nr:hypothetical protein [Patescibacteria group bacterium]